MTKFLMPIFAVTILLTLIWVISFGVAKASDRLEPNGKVDNPFTDDFLEICAPIALSGKGSLTGLFSGWRVARSTSHLRTETRDGDLLCSLFSSYNSDLTTNGDLDRAAFDPQPTWLKNPEQIGSIFDLWVNEHSAKYNLRSSDGCLNEIAGEDPVTKILYNRAVQIGETGRVIVVEIKSQKNSYLEPNGGSTIWFFAWATSSAATCAKVR